VIITRRSPGARALGQLGLGALRDQLAAVDHQDAIARLADLGQDVAADDHAPPLGEPADHVAHADDLLRIEARDRLIQDDQLGVVDHGLGDADALLVAVRQRSDDLVFAAFELGELHHVGSRRATSAAPMPFSRPMCVRNAFTVMSR
jgi:hypothetical protein